MKKLFNGIAVAMAVGLCSSFLWLLCNVWNNYVSEEDYARMAQEIIEPSINLDTKSCIGR